MSKRTRRPCHEDEQVYGRADRICTEASRAGYEGRRDLPQARNKRGDFLQLEEEIRGLGPSEQRRLRQLEEENAKLKRLVADLSLDKAMLQDVLAKKL
ncbi:hypothetical protein WJ58_21655 [Burkholderia ubonensis]|nr:hypothetical protein WJ58_21655 [Burkholderia ubonensis]